MISCFVNKKTIAIVKSEKYSLENMYDASHYDNVEVLLHACRKHPDLFDCDLVNIEDTYVDWKKYDALFLGVMSASNEQHYSHFWKWLSAREKEKIPMINGYQASRLLANKITYLKELQKAGIPIFDAASENIMLLTPDQVDLEAIFAQTSTESIVIKSASATLDDNFVVKKHTEFKEAQNKLIQISEKADVLLQKFMPSIKDGEISFVYYNGQIYAYKKTPSENEHRVHRMYGVTVAPYTPSICEKKQALDVLSALEKISGEKIYKARIDMIRGDNKLYLIEVELLDLSTLLTKMHSENEAIEIMGTYLKSIFI